MLKDNLLATQAASTGSELARDSGVSVCGDVGCAGAIASKLAPTVFGMMMRLRYTPNPLW
nr:hypothetical protein C1892_08675 [Pseudomonas sp. MPBD7-1]